MIGLVLEGGGTRGAYHIGAVQALLEHGIHFDIVTGTSIGAINGAMIAGGRFKELKELYEDMQPGQIIHGSELIYKYLSLSDFTFDDITPDTLGEAGKALYEAFRAGGLDISPLRALLEANIDEQALRSGDVEFGLVTVDLEERKPKELLLSEIPEGKLIDYILASAYLPVFKADKRQFLDGGFYNNLPLDLLLRGGEMEHVYIIRTMGIGRHQSLQRDVPMSVITPSGSLGHTLLINQDKILSNIKMGYYDTLRLLEELPGRRYCVKNIPEDYFFHLFSKLSDTSIERLAQLLGETDIGEPKRFLFEEFIPGLEKILDLRGASYNGIGLELFERFAIEQGIDRYRMLDFSQFESEIQQALASYQPAEAIGLFERLNIFLATTVRLNWQDLQVIIGHVMVELLGGKNGSKAAL